MIENDWEKIFIELFKALEEKGLSYYRTLEKEYRKAARKTIQEINEYYGKFVSENKITLSQAKKTLNKEELREFVDTLEDYIKECKEQGVDVRWINKLEMMQLRERVSRLEAMEIVLQHHAEILYNSERIGVEKVLGEIYEEGYNKTAIELGVIAGLLALAKTPTQKQILKALNKAWVVDELTFSERIWGKHRTALINDLRKGLVRSIIKGESPEVFAKFIAKRYNVSKAQALRLIRTESAYFISESQRVAFEEGGVKQVVFTAVLDERTSDICRSMDGKVFYVSELEVGVNQPPLHVNCRSTLFPYTEKKLKIDKN